MTFCFSNSSTAMSQPPLDGHIHLPPSAYKIVTIKYISLSARLKWMDISNCLDSDDLKCRLEGS